MRGKDFPNGRGVNLGKRLAFSPRVPYGKNAPGNNDICHSKGWLHMENKKTFGAYICRCRKGLGLTQKEFADKLFVTESAVSKWERGLSYPDITLIRDICAVLGVSEHELLTASEDVEARNAETLAKKYLTLLPVLVKQYRGAATLGGFTLSLELLLLAACLFSGGDWFLLASAGVLFGMGAAFLPVVLRELPRPLREHKAVLYLGTETLLLCAFLWAGGAYSGADWFPVPALPGTLFGLALPWAWVLICRYASVGSWWKGAACLGATALFLPLVNPVADRMVLWGGGSVEYRHAFWSRPDLANWSNEWTFNENVLFLTWACLAAAAVLCVILAVRRGKK